MDNPVNRFILSAIENRVHRYGQFVKIEEFIGEVRSIKLKTVNCVFEFHTLWNGDLDPISIILLGEKRYMVFSNTVSDYLSSEDMELYNREIYGHVQVVDLSIPADVRIHFRRLVRNLFKAKDGSLTKRAK